MGAEAARRKRLAKKPGSADPAATAQADDGRENRKSSLRVKTGRKGRAAELSQRRSTLKKRDRTADKIYKAEAALERKTVVIPEYVRLFVDVLMDGFSNNNDLFPLAFGCYLVVVVGL